MVPPTSEVFAGVEVSAFRVPSLQIDVPSVEKWSS
jgi:hypothetical protein